LKKDAERNDFAMPDSRIYLQIREFIEKDWIVVDPTKIVKQLERLKEENQITEAEFKSLLEFYHKKYKNSLL